MAHAHPAHSARSWTERTAPDDVSPADSIDHHLKSQQAFHHANSSLGAHWIHMIGGLLPLALSEFIPEPAKYRKATRIASIATTVAYEMLYTVKELNKRKHQEARLADCHAANER